MQWFCQPHPGYCPPVAALPISNPWIRNYLLESPNNINRSSCLTYPSYSSNSLETKLHLLHSVFAVCPEVTFSLKIATIVTHLLLRLTSNTLSVNLSLPSFLLPITPITQNGICIPEAQTNVESSPSHLVACIFHVYSLTTISRTHESLTRIATKQAWMKWAACVKLLRQNGAFQRININMTSPNVRLILACSCQLDQVTKVNYL